MTRSMTRRDVLVAASASFACACATMPAGGGSAGEHVFTAGRACDHDLCRYWRPDPGLAEAQARFDAVHGREPGFVERGGHQLGRCSIGLPEAFK